MLVDRQVWFSFCCFQETGSHAAQAGLRGCKWRTPDALVPLSVDGDFRCAPSHLGGASFFTCKSVNLLLCTRGLATGVCKFMYVVVMALRKCVTGSGKSCSRRREGFELDGARLLSAVIRFLEDPKSSCA